MSNKLIDAIGNPQAPDKDSGHVIKILHIPTSKYVAFRAFLTQFTDSYASKWTGTSVYGRMDDIYNFQQTTRTINIAWDVPADSVEEAIDNLVRAQKLITFQYPTYQSVVSQTSSGVTKNQTKDDAPNITELKNTIESGDVLDSLIAIGELIVLKDKALGTLKQLKDQALSAQILNSSTVKKGINPGVISSPPLLKIVFDNMIKNANSKVGDSNVTTSGLIGFMDSITFSPDLEAGWFGADTDGITINNLVPKLLKFSCKFTVLHDHPMGWDSNDGSPLFGDFPYNAESIAKISGYVKELDKTLEHVTSDQQRFKRAEKNKPAIDYSNANNLRGIDIESETPYTRIRGEQRGEVLGINLRQGRQPPNVPQLTQLTKQKFDITEEEVKANRKKYRASVAIGSNSRKK